MYYWKNHLSWAVGMSFPQQQIRFKIASVAFCPTKIQNYRTFHWLQAMNSISECQKVNCKYFVSYSSMVPRNRTINTLLLLIPVSSQILVSEKTIMRRRRKELGAKWHHQNDTKCSWIHFTCTTIKCIRRGRDTSMVPLLSSTPRVSMSTFEISWESFIGKVRLLSETSSP